MPITNLFFPDGLERDIHILQGERSRLLIRNGGLIFTTTAGTNVFADQYLRDNTDVALECRPVFRYSNNGTHYNGFGISVDLRTGEVSLTPPVEIPNFLIEVLVIKNVKGPKPEELPLLAVRVHVHQSVRNFWLTPSRMTVRRRTPAGEEQTDFRFTARVEFDDLTVADVTLHHGIRWSAQGFFANQVAAPNLQQEAGFGRIKIPAGLNVNDPPTTITATLPAVWGGRTATAAFTVAAPWASDPNTPKLERFSAVQQTYFGTHPEDFVNVLIVPSGYERLDLPDFESQTAQIVNAVRLDPLSRPLDLLVDSINFWRVPLVSRERGACVRAEVFTREVHGAQIALGTPGVKHSRLAQEVSPPIPGEPDARILGVEHLLYLAGLPMPSDKNLTPPQFGELRTRWSRMWPNGFGLAPDDPWHTGRGLNPLDPKQLPDLSIERWIIIATRTFMDEVDVAIPTAVGHAPNASMTVDDEYPELQLDPERGGAALFNDFLEALQEVNGITLNVPVPGTRLGRLWGPDQTGHRFNHQGLLVVLYGTGVGRPNAAPFIKIRQADVCPCIPVPGRNALAHVPDIIGPTLDADIPRTFVHELGHRLGLGDEYFESPDEVNAVDEPEASFDVHANTTSLAGVTIPDPDHPQFLFRSDVVKWNWERIQAAGVLAQPLKATSATTFDVILHREHARPFKVKQEVRLRRREWGVPIRRVVERGGVYKIDLIAGDQLSLRLIKPGGAFNPDDIGAGSLVYLPVPADRPTPSDPYARMIAPSVAEQINSHNKPLTKWPRTAQEIYADFVKKGPFELPEVIEFNGFGANWSYRANQRIIGLYESAAHHAKGTFRPAGACKMRSSRDATVSFCAVCRYIIVDFVDPTLHGVIDADYDKEYPG